MMAKTEINHEEEEEPNWERTEAGDEVWVDAAGWKGFEHTRLDPWSAGLREWRRRTGAQIRGVF